MKGSILTVLSMENHHPSTLLSMDSSGSSHEELDLEMNNGNRQITLYNPPDINLPLSVGRSSPSWNLDSCDNILDVGLSSHVYETETFLNVVPSKVAKKCLKRGDSMWGAWFFFSFYFKPALNEKSKSKVIRETSNGGGGCFTGFDKSDLKLDVFLVQHDMENMYMWAFKDKPENALGKMQLRSYMNGHSRQGERPFPFSAEKGFVRSHRMQRKHYRGLSNPQCLHGIEFVASPSLFGVSEEDKKRWMELTGRDLKFTIPPDASDFGSWRNLPNTDIELERPAHVTKPAQNNTKKILSGSGLHLTSNASFSSNGDSSDQSPGGVINNKKRKEFLSPGSSEEECCLTVNNIETHHAKDPPSWVNDFTGVMKNSCGPVTAAKTVYEDEEAYLVVITLPFVDLNTVKVSWRNNITNGIVKVTGMSTSRASFVKRRDRTFKLVDQTAEHCPPGEFMREIQLPNRIPEEANIEAYFDGTGPVLEIVVPKLRGGVEEEHEVRVCLRSHHLG
ncbi:HSP20-like chaperone [Arabidopsis thaliana x Arabidopsis arenosa]|uniref:HSP20-like chaperone n=1 Tax=Arabidopsis thaliana x Arabidopsis arenosa TaxID=1240361 RepID=A0A8T1YSX9_9BRAS|nr:HSP20-like chaperone [Arabidopsis thaliana x Arabidopsis arenosa]